MRLRVVWVTLSLSGAASLHAQAAEGERKAFEWSPTGYVQLDSRSFADWDLPFDPTGLERSEMELRRLRAGVEGRWRNASFELSVDPFDEDGAWLKDAVVESRLTKRLRLRVGQFKLPGGREYGTSARRIGSLERSALSESLAAGRDLGLQLELRTKSRLGAALGIFAGDGRSRRDRAGLTAAARVDWEPAKNLEIGASMALGRTDAVADTDTATGTDGRTTTGYRFFDALYVSGLRARLGADVQWRRGSWRFNGEVSRLSEQRRDQAADFSDLPDVVGNAMALSARWQPGRPQLGLRYERLSFDDAGPETELSSVRPRASDIRASGVHALSLSAGWRVVPRLLLLGEGSAERYDDARSAPSAGRKGPYWTVGARLQIELR
jgi:hypothetical protein